MAVPALADLVRAPGMYPVAPSIFPDLELSISLRTPIWGLGPTALPIQEVSHECLSCTDGLAHFPADRTN